MENTVFIVDDDAAVRDALGLLLGLHGYRTAFFASGGDLLGVLRPDWRGCLLIDIRMPGLDGLALLEQLRQAGCAIPVVIITGHGSVDAARAAFRAEAVDFLEKPLDEHQLIAAIEEAFRRQDALQSARRLTDERERRLAALTPRERQVMDLVVAGRHNREIAAELAISVRTVEVHKARVMAKLGVDSVPQLVRASLGG